MTSHFFGLLLLCVLSAAAAQRYRATGMVLKTEPQNQSATISHDAIPGFMDAMVMPFRFRDTRTLKSLKPGMKVAFTLVAGGKSSFVENVRITSFEAVDRDPLLVRRLALLDRLNPSQTGAAAVEPGQPVPDFTLTDQLRRPVTLAQFRGKVVALSFIYTRCPLPDYCVRLSNNFSQVRRRFPNALGGDLILLTVTIDPRHDQPETLAAYARTWKADGDSWRFLTGSPADLTAVWSRFGVDAFLDEGILAHSLRTAIVDREGKLVANLSGNEFTAKQLGDLIETALAKKR